MDEMTILITGGLGFIGTSLVKELQKEHKLLIIDKNKYTVSRYTKSENVEYALGDVCDKPFLYSILENKNIAGVVHLAAVSRVVVGENQPEECLRTNIEGVSTLLQVIHELGQKPWQIFGSSREIYGEPTSFPVKEGAAHKPINLYGWTKLMGEEKCRDFALYHNTSCAILRFSNVYGTENDLSGRVIPNFIRAISTGEEVHLEGGEQEIDFTYIDDTVKAIAQTADHLEKLSTIENTPLVSDFNVCHGKGESLYNLIDYIERITGKKAIIKKTKARTYDVVKYCGSTEKLEKTIGVTCPTSLREGLSKSINHYITTKE